MDHPGLHLIEREQWLDRPVEEVFAFFADAANLQAITPAWLRFRLLSPEPIPMHPGALIDYRLRWRGVPLRWRTLIEAWEPPHRFIDTQLRGPYRLWHHTHTFQPRDGGTLVRDAVRYRLPLGPLGTVFHTLGVRRDLEAIFDFRARRVRERLDAPGPPATAGSPARSSKGTAASPPSARRPPPEGAGPVTTQH